MPGIVPHSHANGTCPVTGATSHAYCAPQEGDSRAPCPALNTLANHGYLPRDGKQLTASLLVEGLKSGYRLSEELAFVLAYGGVYLIHQSGSFQLSDLARHNRIEHDQSLIHDDCAPRNEYASNTKNKELWIRLIGDAKDGKKLTTYDVAKARVRREKEALKEGKQKLDGFHAEIARGEMAIVLGLFEKSGEDGEVPLDILKDWMWDERFPEGWKPTHEQGLMETVRASVKLREAMTEIKAQEEKAQKEMEKAQKALASCPRKDVSLTTTVVEAEREIDVNTSVEL